MKVLVGLGIDINLKARNKQTAMHLVAKTCSPTHILSVMHFLIENNHSVPRQAEGKTVMFFLQERKEIKIDSYLFSNLVRIIKPSVVHNDDDKFFEDDRFFKDDDTIEKYNESTYTLDSSSWFDSAIGSSEKSVLVFK